MKTLLRCFTQFRNAATRGDAARSVAGGFTILEVLITAVIIAIGLLAVASMHVLAIKGNTSGERLTVATLLANSKIAEVKTLKYYADITGAPTPQQAVIYSDTAINPGDYSDTVAASGGCQNSERCVYSRSWNIEEVLESGRTFPYRRITVTVRWSDPDAAGGGDSITLPTNIIPLKYR